MQSASSKAENDAGATGSTRPPREAPQGAGRFCIDRATFKLAEGAYLARSDDELLALRLALGETQNLIAAKVGASGHPGFVAAEDLGHKHVRKLCSQAAEELTRACSSTDSRPSRADLEEAWTELLQQTLPAAQESLTHFLAPHDPGGSAASPAIRRWIESAERQGRAIAAADFAHFVAQQGRDRRRTLWSGVSWFFAAFTGAILARSPDAIAWLLHH